MGCILCDSKELELLDMPKYNRLITGDRKIFRGKDIKKVICKECGGIQHLVDDNYKIQIAKVFKEYETLYTKSFSADGKVINSRLKNLYQKIGTSLQLPARGTMLDIGCGGGESLMYFGELFPEWDLYGMDIGEHFRESVMTIERVQAFFTTIAEVRESQKEFDFVSINYALCEVQNVIPILKMVHEVLSEQGILFVVDTDFSVQPYVVNTVEASVFFDKEMLQALLRRWGFEIMDVDFEHEKKEIWAFAKRGVDRYSENRYEINRRLYEENLRFLNNAVAKVEDVVAHNQNIGIWGMANAGVWIAEIIEAMEKEDGKTFFFIDEDEEILKRKIGVNGFPICRVEDVKQEAAVLLPFPSYVAQNIRKRYEDKYEHLKMISLE